MATKRRSNNDTTPSPKRAKTQTSVSIIGGSIDDKDEEEKINKILTNLHGFSIKSKVCIYNSHDDCKKPLNPFVLINNYSIIPIQQDIINSIQQSKCLIANTNNIIDLIATFICDDKIFTTTQFLELLAFGYNDEIKQFHNHKKIDSFDKYNNLERFCQFFHEIISDWNDIGSLQNILTTPTIVKLFEETKCKLTKEIVMNKDRMNYPESCDENEDEGDIPYTKWNWQFVDYMNEKLFDCIVINILCDTQFINDIEEEPYDELWDDPYYTFIIGRTKNGHIAGYHYYNSIT
eukprot:157339_1